MIQVSNLTKKFGQHVSLDNVSIDFEKNNYIALMGPNGAGKTTLIRSMLGYYHPDEGDVSINGLDPIKERTEVLKDISFVPQLPPPIKLSLNELMQYIQTSSDVDKELIASTKWFDIEITATKEGDFFYKKQVDYNKKSKSITVDDLF